MNDQSQMWLSAKKISNGDFAPLTAFFLSLLSRKKELAFHFILTTSFLCKAKKCNFWWQIFSFIGRRTIENYCEKEMHCLFLCCFLKQPFFHQMPLLRQHFAFKCLRILIQFAKVYKHFRKHCILVADLGLRWLGTHEKTFFPFRFKG